MRQLARTLIATCVAVQFGGHAPAGPSALAGMGSHGMLSHDRPAAEVCNFCHTPQGRPEDGPGWISHQSPAEFPSFDTQRADGSVGVNGSVSVACLSCHDGSQAAEGVLNARGLASPPGIAQLSRAAVTDHPTGIVFSGYRAQQTAQPSRVDRLQSDIIGNEIRWWVDAEPVPNGIRDKHDLILFTRGEGTAAEPYIECATCHDPHANPASGFLRAAAGSDPCQACHAL